MSSLEPRLKYTRCCIQNCLNKDLALSYHRFPEDQILRQKWVDAIATTQGSKPFDFGLRICSKHFLQTDYFSNAAAKVRRRLKPFTVPSVFVNTKVTDDETLPKCFYGHLSGEEKTELLKERGALNIDPVHSKDLDPKDTLPPCSDIATTPTDVVPPSISSYCPYTTRKIELLRKRIQPLNLRSKEKFSVTEFINNDKAIKYFTGFPSYKMFWAFYQLLLPKCSNHFVREASQMTDNRDKEVLEVVKPGWERQLNPIEEFFIALAWLRQGTEEQFLASLYDTSLDYVSKIINTWILFLFERCTHLPSKERVEKYPNLRLIVNSTEFRFEKPSEAQRKSFGAYKHCNTAKALIGIAGSGHVTYCSNLYAGRISDKKLILHCGVLDTLEEGDVLMADCSFDIAKELELRKIKLIRPEILKLQDQFASKELSESRNIANALIHSERAIRRIKEFKILKGDISLTLSPMLEKIYVVCCYLSNLTGN